MPANRPRPRGLFEEEDRTLLRFTIGLNRMAANHQGVNVYFLRNQILMEEEKALIRAQNGFTTPLAFPAISLSQAANASEEAGAASFSTDGKSGGAKQHVKYDDKGKTSTTPTPYTKEELKADGKRSGKHSRTLGNNLEKAGFARPDHVCAHHIVARGEPDALPSRDLLYGWGIGINDADNGVFLPRYKDVKVEELPKATHHGTLHKSLVYCARVHRRLTNLPDGATQEMSRKALRRMREEMTQGIFPYK